MNARLMAFVLLVGMAACAHTAPPAGPPGETKAAVGSSSTPKDGPEPPNEINPLKLQSENNALNKEIASLKNQLTHYAEQYELVVQAAKQVSLDEHATRHDHALSQQVQINRLQNELKKLQSAQTAKN